MDNIKMGSKEDVDSAVEERETEEEENDDFEFVDKKEISSLTGVDIIMSVRCKVCLVGEMAVGKTSLANRYITGTHTRKYSPNFVAHHYSSVKMNMTTHQSMFIWDTAGSERFRSMTPNYLRGAHCCLLTFSLTDKASFDEIVNYWTASVRDWAPHAKCVLVANKSDDDDRAVTPQEIKSFCNTERIKYFETSAVTGSNVEDVFNYAAKAAKKQSELNSLVDSFQLYDDIPDAVKKNKWCCG